jgi:LPS O-antigen subunit length determinant protein (WzzB/FepE family)
LKPVVVPTEKSAPKRSLIVIIWLFLGVVVSIGYLLAKEPVKNIIKEIKNIQS